MDLSRYRWVALGQLDTLILLSRFEISPLSDISLHCSLPSFYYKERPYGPLLSIVIHPVNASHSTTLPFPLASRLIVYRLRLAT
jgi:hypothetical protein